MPEAVDTAWRRPLSWGRAEVLYFPAKYLPTYQPSQQGLFFSQRQSSDPGVRLRHTLHCWKEGREHDLLKARFWQLLGASMASASTGMKIELNPAYLKSEGKG